MVPHRLKEVQAKVTDMLHEQASQSTPDGIVHQLWQLLWAVRRESGMPETRAGGQSVVVEHHYIANGRDRLTVRINASHLSAVNRALSRGRELPLGEVLTGTIRLGKVGLTGNARSSHLHMQIQLCRPSGPQGNVTAFGAVFPHEFFLPRYLPA